MNKLGCIGFQFYLETRRNYNLIYPGPVYRTTRIAIPIILGFILAATFVQNRFEKYNVYISGISLTLFFYISSYLSGRLRFQEPVMEYSLIETMISRRKQHLFHQLNIKREVTNNEILESFIVDEEMYNKLDYYYRVPFNSDYYLLALGSIVLAYGLYFHFHRQYRFKTCLLPALFFTSIFTVTFAVFSIYTQPSFDTRNHLGKGLERCRIA